VADRVLQDNNSDSGFYQGATLERIAEDGHKIYAPHVKSLTSGTPLEELLGLLLVELRLSNFYLGELYGQHVSIEEVASDNQ